MSHSELLFICLCPAAPAAAAAAAAVAAPADDEDYEVVEEVVDVGASEEMDTAADVAPAGA